MIGAPDLEKVAKSIEASKDRQMAWLHRHLSLTPEESLWQECLEMVAAPQEGS